MCTRAEEPFFGRAVSAIHDCRSPLKTHIDLLSSSLNCCLKRGLLCGEGVGQVELRFCHSTPIVFFDGELRRENVLPLG